VSSAWGTGDVEEEEEEDVEEERAFLFRFRSDLDDMEVWEKLGGVQRMAVGDLFAKRKSRDPVTGLNTLNLCFSFEILGS